MRRIRRNSVAEERSWQEFWAGGEGDAVGGAQRHKLAAHWSAFFSGQAGRNGAAPLVIDIAAGRGVALGAAIDAFGGAGSFLAIDYAPEAAASARRALGAALAVAADAARLPLADACASAVISQYGVEYAGEGAFLEAARLLAPGGRFCSISHFRGGAIDLECSENERLLRAVANTHLFAAARAALGATFARHAQGDAKPIDPDLESAFATALGGTAEALRAAPALAARATLERFLADVSRLSARRLAFEPAEAIGWLDGMEASLGAYTKRMQSMRAAALDDAAINRIATIFSQSGLVGFRAEPLHLDDRRPPAGWIIEARRPD